MPPKVVDSVTPFRWSVTNGGGKGRARAGGLISYMFTRRFGQGKRGKVNSFQQILSSRSLLHSAPVTLPSKDYTRTLLPLLARLSNLLLSSCHFIIELPIPTALVLFPRALEAAQPWSRFWRSTSRGKHYKEMMGWYMVRPISTA